MTDSQTENITQDETSIIISKSAMYELFAKNIPQIVKNSLTSSYNNPFEKAINEMIKEKDGLIRQFIETIIMDVLNDKTLREKIQIEIVAKMVSMTLVK